MTIEFLLQSVFCQNNQGIDIYALIVSWKLILNTSLDVFQTGLEQKLFCIKWSGPGDSNSGIFFLWWSCLWSRAVRQFKTYHAHSLYGPAPSLPINATPTWSVFNIQLTKATCYKSILAIRENWHSILDWCNQSLKPLFNWQHLPHFIFPFLFSFYSILIMFFSSSVSFLIKPSFSISIVWRL